MPKFRGKYKQYNWNNEKEIPLRTEQRRNQQRISKLPENSNVVVNKNSTFQEYNSFIFETDLNNETDLITNTSTNFDHESDQSIIEEIISSDKYDLRKDVEENVFDDFIEANSTGVINQNDLATAYLAAFFNGRTTQDSLKDYLRLSNFSSQIKLPTTFDGLSQLVVGKKNSVKFEKSWFCNTCTKQITRVNTNNALITRVITIKFNSSITIQILTL